jgi:hypothetical protein
VLGPTAVRGFVWGAGTTTGFCTVPLGAMTPELGGRLGGNVAFGLRASTFVFSRFTWSIRSCLPAPSFMDCTVLLTSAS